MNSEFMQTKQQEQLDQIEKAKNNSVTMVKIEGRMSQVEATLKDYVELIDSLNEKQTLSDEVINKTRSQMT